MRAVWTLIEQTFRHYGRHNCSQMAAAMSYYVLFSIVPLTLFLASIFGFVMRDESTRREVVDRIVEAIPLEQDEGANLVSDTLRGVARVSAPLSLLALVGMGWSSSAMFGSVRRAINIVWGVERERPFVQQKLTDLAMMGSLSVALLLSIVGTGFLRTLRETSTEWLGPVSANTNWFWEVVRYLLPAFFSFAVFASLYRYVPRAKVRLGEVWPAALLATVLFEALKNSFAFYVANFRNYDLAYGALGGIMIFLFWTYLSANILLLGAEMSARLAELRAGVYEGPPSGVPWWRRLTDWALGLVVQREEKKPVAGRPRDTRHGT